MKVVFLILGILFLTWLLLGCPDPDIYQPDYDNTEIIESTETNDDNGMSRYCSFGLNRYRKPLC